MTALAEPLPVVAAEEACARLTALAAERLAAGRLHDAARLGEAALAHDRNAAGALHVRGLAASRLGQRELAIVVFERAISVPGAAPRSFLELINLYQQIERLDDALHIGTEALRRWPGNAALRFALGLVHRSRGEFATALDWYGRTLASQPDHAAAHLGRGQMLLSRGDWAEGWDEYEWRWRLPGVKPVMPATDRPQWNGQELDGTLVLVTDQGFGDSIQFMRYIPLAAARCQTLVVGTSDALLPFVRQQHGVTATFKYWRDLPRFAAWCPLTGLGRAFGTETATIPRSLPYIRADAARADRWREVLAQRLPAGHLRVGIVWAGRTTHPNDRRRSMHLRQLLPLAALCDVALVSLQKGPAEIQLRNFWSPAPLVNGADGIRDFADTAGLIEVLDLVITVDTAIAHLAGALAKPVWVMLPFAPDWRWMQAREDSPWYPTMRLFRQPAPGDWTAVVARVRQELATLQAG